MQHDSGRRRWGARKSGNRDLATEAQGHAQVRDTFIRHALARLSMISLLVITINLFVQVRGDVGLAVAVTQNLTFGAIAVIVLLNVVVYIILGVMVVLMPLVFDRDYNRWTRIVGSAALVLLTVVLAYTTPWLIIVALIVVFIVISIVVLRSRRQPPVQVTRANVTDVLLTPEPPVDSGLHLLWAEGRAMLRIIAPATAPPVSAAEQAIEPPPEPRVLADIADDWNHRSAQIREPRTKSVSRLAFAGVIGFIALFGLTLLTQPIRFAPLELVSINGSDPEPGFVLLQGARGMFVPDPSGAAQFISAGDITSIQLCNDIHTWWSVSVIDVLSPQPQSGVDCSGH
ncbi:hypothetical protein [Subtercola sp. YIM 133946]|uniref:hypothetical protein n=1 Tax=Subtercola sp. YIM 133946 TaxID=3118909 RepID=UPI002F94A333